MISVIIPVYNTDKYLEQCISSVREQSFRDLEILLVDDGSTDGSEEICRAAERSDPRIRYFRKENGSAASARNFGLSKAAGEYVAFVDSDDRIAKDHFQKLAAPTGERGYSIVQCGMTLIRNGVGTELSFRETDCGGEEYERIVISEQIPIFLLQSTVSKLYCRELLEESGVTFNEQVSFSEDCLFNTELMPFVKSYRFVDGNGYFYNQDNEDSLSHNRKRDFEAARETIRISNRTTDIREECISKNGWRDDPEIVKGFQKTVCIILLSNAREIETSNVSAEEREELYGLYFDRLNYPVDRVIGEYSGTDRAIIKASLKKDHGKIHRIYRLRAFKRRIMRIVKR